jgi:hypothetical protein
MFVEPKPSLKVNIPSKLHIDASVPSPLLMAHSNPVSKGKGAIGSYASRAKLSQAQSQTCAQVYRI